MNETSSNQTDTPASEKSTYFDAPISHFHMDSASEPGHGESSLVHAAAQTVSPTQPVVAEDLTTTSQPGSEGHHVEPHDFVYVDGNWAVRKPSKPGSRRQSVRRPASRSLSPAVSTVPTEDGTKNGNRGAVSVNGSTRRGRSVVRSYIGGGGSTFASGAGTTGPAATPDLDGHIHSRAASAEASLTPKLRSKIAKGERKEGKQLMKVINKESKIEKEALSVTIKELAELQAIQKAAVRTEAKAHTDHAAALTAFQKAERAFLAARTKYETSQGEVLALEEALETGRRHAREVTESMQDKMREVEFLRAQKSVDDREREVKIMELTGKKSSTLKKWL